MDTLRYQLVTSLLVERQANAERQRLAARSGRQSVSHLASVLGRLSFRPRRRVPVAAVKPSVQLRATLIPEEQR